MHKIRLSWGLRPRQRWRSLQRSPYPLAVFKGLGPKGKGKRGGEEKGEGKGEGRGRGREKGGEDRGGEGPGPQVFLPRTAPGCWCIELCLAWSVSMSFSC